MEGRALVIVGPSRSGKSALAHALIATSRPKRRVELVGDDRVILTVRPDGDIVVRPHPRIAGFIERRGLGLVAVAHRASATAVGMVALGPATTRRPDNLNLPVLELVRIATLAQRRDLVCDWWPTVSGAALGTHPAEKARVCRDERGET